MDERLPQSDTVNLRSILFGVAVIVAGIVVSLLAAWFFVAWSGTSAQGSNNVAEPEEPAPALQTAPQTDRERYFREKRDLLETYGWTDRKAGRIHVPIEKAMELMVARSRR